MRIIAGDAKGRRLVAPAGENTRPTSDKIRGSIFNILMAQVPDSSVLDLFGGTGALALEALSRGATSAVIVDKDVKAIDAIRKNRATTLGEDDTRVEVVRADFKRAIAGFAGRKFDIVFLDPPYALEDAYREAIDALFGVGAIDRETVIVMERARSREINVGEHAEIYDSRTYSDTIIDFAHGR